MHISSSCTTLHIQSVFDYIFRKETAIDDDISHFEKWPTSCDDHHRQFSTKKSWIFFNRFFDAEEYWINERIFNFYSIWWTQKMLLWKRKGVEIKLLKIFFVWESLESVSQTRQFESAMFGKYRGDWKTFELVFCHVELIFVCRENICLRKKLAILW